MPPRPPRGQDVRRFGKLSLGLVSNGDYHSIATIFDAIFKLNQPVFEDPTATVDQGEERRVNEVKDSTIGSWMPIFVFLRDVFEFPSSSLKRLFDRVWNRDVGFDHVAVEDSHLIISLSAFLMGIKFGVETTVHKSTIPKTFQTVK